MKVVSTSRPQEETLRVRRSRDDETAPHRTPRTAAPRHEPRPRLPLALRARAQPSARRGEAPGWLCAVWRRRGR
jgi:hypothetical protein